MKNLWRIVMLALSFFSVGAIPQHDYLVQQAQPLINMLDMYPELVEAILIHRQYSNTVKHASANFLLNCFWLQTILQDQSQIIYTQSVADLLQSLVNVTNLFTQVEVQEANVLAHMNQTDDCFYQIARDLQIVD